MACWCYIFTLQLTLSPFTLRYTTIVVYVLIPVRITCSLLVALLTVWYPRSVDYRIKSRNVFNGNNDDKCPLPAEANEDQARWRFTAVMWCSFNAWMCFKGALFLTPALPLVQSTTDASQLSHAISVDLWVFRYTNLHVYMQSIWILSDLILSFI